MPACCRGQNILVSGATQSGKTTLLNALLSASRPHERIVTVRRSSSSTFRASDTVAMQCRQPSLEGTGEITLRRLIKEALRMRPDRLVVGEVREAESLDLLIALNSGLPGMCSIHANSARDALAKLCTLPLLAGRNIDSAFVVPTVASAIDIVVHCELLRTGHRRIAEIAATTGRVTGSISRNEHHLRAAARTRSSHRRATREDRRNSGPAAFDPSGVLGERADDTAARAAGSGSASCSPCRLCSGRRNVAGATGELFVGVPRPARAGRPPVRERAPRRRGVADRRCRGAAVTFALVPVVALAAAAGLVAARCLSSWSIGGPGAVGEQPACCGRMPSITSSRPCAAGCRLPDSVVTLAHIGPEATARTSRAFERDYVATGNFAIAVDGLKARLADPVADRILETLRMSREVGGTELTTVLRNLSRPAAARSPSAPRSKRGSPGS